MPRGVARLHGLGAAAVSLAAGPWRALYVDRGVMVVNGGRIEAGTAELLGRAALEIAPEDTGARGYLWEIGGADRPLPEAPPGLASLGDYDMPLLAEDDPAAPSAAILRCERVDLIDGVETPPHTHRGSGLRVLLSGRLEASLDGVTRALQPGDAWLERGPGEVVVGAAAPSARTSFVRLLVLPAAAAGQDSFIDLSGTPGPRPRPADYRRYFEKEVML